MRRLSFGCTSTTRPRRYRRRAQKWVSKSSALQPANDLVYRCPHQQNSSMRKKVVKETASYSRVSRSKTRSPCLKQCTTSGSTIWNKVVLRHRDTQQQGHFLVRADLRTTLAARVWSVRCHYPPQLSLSLSKWYFTHRLGRKKKIIQKKFHGLLTYQRNKAHSWFPINSNSTRSLRWKIMTIMTKMK